MDINEKLTEDETVELLMDFLKSDGYNILNFWFEGSCIPLISNLTFL